MQIKINDFGKNHQKLTTETDGEETFSLLTSEKFEHQTWNEKGK